jgi:cytochrome c oxidase subunit 2
MSKNKKCPECGVTVKSKNYNRHLKKVHNLSVSSSDFDSRRGSTFKSQRRKMDFVVVSIVIVIVLVAAYIGFIYNPSDQNYVENDITPVNDQNIREIKIDAKRFNFSPDVIELKKGETVKLSINNLDTTHGIVIPDLGVSGNTRVEFTPDKTGTFSFYCGNYCGNDHHGMSGSIVVM